jgi:hypothetical protein
VRSESDIGDALVGGMAGVDGKGGVPPDLLVGSRFAERLAAKPWLTAENLDALEFSIRRKMGEDHEREAYQDYRQSAAEPFGHAVTLWFHSLVAYDTFT